MELRRILRKFSFFKHVFYHIHGIDISLHKTLYANLCAFSLKDALKFPIIVHQGTVIEEMGIIKLNCPIRRGIVVIGKRMFYRGNKTIIINRGTIEINGDVEIMGGSTIHVLRPSSVLKIGNGVMISELNRILVDTTVSIDDYSRLAYGTTVIDSEFHFVINIKDGSVGTTRYPIHIGKYCWIGNSSVIKKGTVIPDFTIVSNGAMVTKDFSEIPPYSILQGVPAKVKVSGYRRIYNEKIDAELNAFFIDNPQLRKTTITITETDKFANDICEEDIHVHKH